MGLGEEEHRGAYQMENIVQFVQRLDCLTVY